MRTIRIVVEVCVGAQEQCEAIERRQWGTVSSGLTAIRPGLGSPI